MRSARARLLISILPAIFAAACVVAPPISLPDSGGADPAPTATPVATPTPAPAPQGITGVMPWALKSSALGAAQPGDALELVYDPDEIFTEGGDLLPINVDGTTTVSYESAAASGSTSAACARGMVACDPSACPGEYAVTCAESSPGCDSYLCSLKTGNLTSPTRSALSYRLSETPAGCATFEQATVLLDDGTFAAASGCEPDAVVASRIMLIPVTDIVCTNICEITIDRFARVWLDGVAGRGCVGAQCTMSVRLMATFGGTD